MAGRPDPDYTPEQGYDGRWSGDGRIEGGGVMVERVEGGWRMERQDDANWAKARWKGDARSGERRDDGGKMGQGGWQDGKRGDGWGAMGTGWQGSSGHWGGKYVGAGGSSPEDEGEWVTRQTGERVWMRSDGAHIKGEKAGIALHVINEPEVKGRMGYGVATQASSSS